ncbi:MAG: hypothetical protein SV108_06430 [Pseudomonadota bacterium]|nr:hypothetical protein [Pseudomonadota bacterium]
MSTGAINRRWAMRATALVLALGGLTHLPAWAQTSMESPRIEVLTATSETLRLRVHPYPCGGCTSVVVTADADTRLLAGDTLLPLAAAASGLDEQAGVVTYDAASGRALQIYWQPAAPEPAR